MRLEKQPKELKDLNLLDRFLFAETTEDPEALQIILEIILGREVMLKHLPQAEKEVRKALWSKIIKLDVLAEGADDTLYNTEVQKQNTGNIPRRSRYYNSVIDSKLLQPGNISYNELRNVYIITIMPFDLFGRGRYRYTFRMMCEEMPGLALNDGATRIFLCTKGSDPEGVSEELIGLLRYFEHSTKETAEISGSERIRMLHDKVEAIKSNEELGVRHMNAWEERILDRQEAFEEGLSEGKAEERTQIAKNFKEAGIPTDVIAKNTGLSEEEVRKL